MYVKSCIFSHKFVQSFGAIVVVCSFQGKGISSKLSGGKDVHKKSDEDLAMDVRFDFNYLRF